MAAFLVVLGVAGVSIGYLRSSPEEPPATIAFDEEEPAPIVERLDSGAAAAAEAMAADTPQEKACAGEAAYCVGVVTGLGLVDDGGMNAAMWDLVSSGVSGWSTEDTQVQVDLIETVRSVDLSGNIDVFVDSDYDLIITVGSYAARETIRAAEANPDVDFIGVLQRSSTGLPNYRTVTGDDAAAASLALQVAGAASSEKSVGVLLPPTVDPNYELLESGAVTAALAANVELFVTHQPTLRSGSAATWAPKVLSELLEEEVDVVVVLGVADEAGVLDVLGALGSDALCVGHGSDQWLAVVEGRSCLLTSVVVDPGDALSEMVSGLVNGERPPASLDGSYRLAEVRPLTPNDEGERLGDNLSEEANELLGQLLD